MSDQGSERATGPDAEPDEIVHLAGLPCLPSVEEAFERHFTIAWLEALKVRQQSALIGFGPEGTADADGLHNTRGRSVVWKTLTDGRVIVTVTKQPESWREEAEEFFGHPVTEGDQKSDPKTYSLEWRTVRNADDVESMYVHALWLGDASQRPVSGASGT